MPYFTSLLMHSKEESESVLEPISDDFEASSNSLKLFKEALDETSIVAITNPDGAITYVNDKFCLISKYTRKELIGQNHRILKSDHHSLEFYKNLWETISSGEIWRGIIKNKAKDDSFYWVKTTIIPILIDGVITQYIAIRIDITKQIELTNKLTETLDKLKKSNETVQKQSNILLRQERIYAIGELSSRLAHDIRNPMTVIKGQVDLLKFTSDNQDSKTVQRYQEIETAIQRIVHQIESIMDFIKLKPLNLEKSNLRKILENVVNSLVKSDGMVINLPDNDVFLRCDYKQLEVVFENIILNSIQAIDNTGIIDIMLTETADHIVIKIQDSGSGIPEKSLSEIFDPLFTTKQEGTGLGLVSCQTIVTHHNGEISVKNNPTTFTITLPKIIDSKKIISKNLDITE